jgi:hypothetical protein
MSSLLIVHSLAYILLLCLPQSQTSKPIEQTTTPTTTEQEKEKDSKFPPIGTWEEELRANNSLRIEEKDYLENLQRAYEVAEIGLALHRALKSSNSITAAEWKKIQRLEKLVKSIRSEAGGGSNEEIDIGSPPTTLQASIARIADMAGNICTLVETTPKRVVSAPIIDSTNQILKLIAISRKLNQRSNHQ